ncbi:hypothetical protein JCGZ_06177 [Jatropha curcas]|uniref:C3H1-type domain-containing protein n=1 Tax=Jatropha curcas TaxID=180498 RepID=A0A067KLK0_JATCU|nr:zinc finger CCCH domain-containing protein 39 [Jatropha curcas]KDP37121.1 hypothetical protein JCGZ_06177 [Jatropha curcas]
MLESGTQFKNKEHENFSQNGNPRTDDIFVPNTTMPVINNHKTQLCEKFKLGYCSYGSNCTFAHGNCELRKQLPNLEGPICNDDGLARTWNCNGDSKRVDQSHMCRMFYSRKECTYGDKCRFLHVTPEKFKRDLGCYRESSAIRIGSIGLSGGHESGIGSSKPWIKKRLCKYWEMKGRCSYGKMCCFAHGQAELEKSTGHIELASEVEQTKASKTFLVPGMEFTSRWKALKKLSGIYADWIEDIPLLHNSVNKTEKCI